MVSVHFQMGFYNCGLALYTQCTLSKLLHNNYSIAYFYNTYQKLLFVDAFLIHVAQKNECEMSVHKITRVYSFTCVIQNFAFQSICQIVSPNCTLVKIHFIDFIILRRFIDSFQQRMNLIFVVSIFSLHHASLLM